MTSDISAELDVRQVVDETQEYYDGPADEIYRRLWGDNVHMGTWLSDDDDLETAMDRTNRIMAAQANIRSGSEVLDVGCGYGASAIFLATEYGCRVTGLNISEKELELARQRAAEVGVADKVTFEYGDFHDLPQPDGSYDAVWSQEAFLHGADKPRILAECLRVLRPGGALVMTDLLVREGVPEEERQRIYARVHSPGMWDLGQYAEALTDAGFQVRAKEDWQGNVAPTYESVLARLREERDALEGPVPTEQLDSTVAALQLWVRSAREGKISHGLVVADRPA